MNQAILSDLANHVVMQQLFLINMIKIKNGPKCVQVDMNMNEWWLMVTGA